jgi:hypothetical protein
MSRIGTPRPGNGGARIGAGRPRKVPASGSTASRPRFKSGRQFALWCLNAPDSEVPMAAKIKAAIALMVLDAKHPTASKRKPAAPGAEGIYATRPMKPFTVVDGSRKPPDGAA